MKITFAPNPGRQTEFMVHPARTVGYGGSAGSGKSKALQMHHMYMLEFETQRWKRGEIAQSNAWCLYFRRVYPRLKEAISDAIVSLKTLEPRVKWNATDHMFTYPCGLKFEFGAMEKTHDWMSYQGRGMTGIYFDELTEFEEEQFDQIDARLRNPDPALARFQNIRWGSNPTGPGLLWVRRRFVEPAPPGTTIRVRTKLADGRLIDQDQVFIQAFLKDNPWLFRDGQYEAGLRKNKAHIARALLEGDWWYSPGGLLSEWWQNKRHVCDNHMPPPNVFRYRSGDFGINEPSSITWWYIDYDGCKTAYYHLYVKGLTADKIAGRIREIERYFGDWDEEADRSMLKGPLDAQCFKRGGTSGPSIAQEFMNHGVPWFPSIKDRFNGIAEIARHLSQFIEVKRADGTVVKKPMLRYMKRCEVPIRLLPILPSDPLNPGDVPKGCEDHVIDDLMYCVGAYPMKKPKLALVRDSDSLDEEDEYEKRFTRSRGFMGIG